MQIIPLNPVPSQTLKVTLNSLPTGAGTPQQCQLNVYQKFYGLHLDLGLNGVLLAAGCLCQNLNPLIRDAALGFLGDLEFLDTQGTDDPTYTGLGARFQLIYTDVYDQQVLSSLVSTPTGGIGGGISASSANVSSTITLAGGLRLAPNPGQYIPPSQNVFDGIALSGSPLPVPQGPGAPSQFDPTTHLVLPWSNAVSAAFNGYQNGALCTPLNFVASNQIYWLSTVNNNTNNPDLSLLGTNNTYGGWVPLV